MTAVVSTRLNELEAVVDRGIKHASEAWIALMQIRDEKLHEETHETFDDYVQDRFGISRATAYRMINAAKVCVRVSPMGDKLPANERVARELAKADESEQAAIWEDVVDEHDAPTAADVREAVERRANRKQAEQSVKDSEQAESDRITKWVDQFGTFQNRILAVGRLIESLDEQEKSMISVLMGDED